MPGQKLIYVLGPAYSGSTIFGLALGRHPGVVNLGEAINLQHDYRARARCTCGSTLADCVFWQAVRRELDTLADRGECPEAGRLREEGIRNEIDRRGGLVKLLYPLRSMSRLYSASVVDEYRAQNRALFHAAGKASGAGVLVDLSKSPERLDILLSDPEVDLWCVYLDRDPEAVYASTMARPKRTRARFGFKAVRESFWLAYRRWHMNRVFARVPPDRRWKLDVGAFEENPGPVLESIGQWLGLPARGWPTGDEARGIKLREQHVYVGNRWLFREDGREAVIAPGTSTRPLTAGQRRAFRLFNR